MEPPLTIDAHFKGPRMRTARRKQPLEARWADGTVLTSCLRTVSLCGAVRGGT